MNETYAERDARIDLLASDLERIAYRLRQGAIADDVAAARLTAIGALLARDA